MQMQRRRVSLQDIALVLQLGDHVEGRDEGTKEACTQVDGKPLTVVYDSTEHKFKGVYYVITVLRRMCSE